MISCNVVIMDSSGGSVPPNCSGSMVLLLSSLMIRTISSSLLPLHGDVVKSVISSVKSFVLHLHSLLSPTRCKSNVNQDGV